MELYTIVSHKWGQGGFISKDLHHRFLSLLPFSLVVFLLPAKEENNPRHYSSACVSGGGTKREVMEWF